MPEDVISVWNAVLLVFLGGLIAVLGPVITDSIKTRRRNATIRKAIITELNEARFRFASVVYLVESRFGTRDRKLLEWVLPLLESYTGPNPSASLVESIRKLLECDDNQLRACAQNARAEPGGALSVKKHRVPYIESRLLDLDAFDEESQALIFDIQSRFAAYNEEVEEARYYFRLTYEPGVSEANHH
ncbi:MAG: hypothetical protein AAB834_00850, partial [Patescibacteria group bacterium]